jgi:hypothetical protein
MGKAKEEKPKVRFTETGSSANKPEITATIDAGVSELRTLYEVFSVEPKSEDAKIVRGMYEFFQAYAPVTLDMLVQEAEDTIDAGNESNNGVPELSETMEEAKAAFTLAGYDDSTTSELLAKDIMDTLLPDCHETIATALDMPLETVKPYIAYLFKTQPMQLLTLADLAQTCPPTPLEQCERALAGRVHGDREFKVASLPLLKKFIQEAEESNFSPVVSHQWVATELENTQELNYTDTVKELRGLKKDRIVSEIDGAKGIVMDALCDSAEPSCQRALASIHAYDPTLIGKQLDALEQSALLGFAKELQSSYLSQQPFDVEVRENLDSLATVVVAAAVLSKVMEIDSSKIVAKLWDFAATDEQMLALTESVPAFLARKDHSEPEPGHPIQVGVDLMLEALNPRTFALQKLHAALKPNETYASPAYQKIITSTIGMDEALHNKNPYFVAGVVAGMLQKTGELDQIPTDQAQFTKLVGRYHEAATQISQASVSQAQGAEEVFESSRALGSMTIAAMHERGRSFEHLRPFGLQRQAEMLQEAASASGFASSCAGKAQHTVADIPSRSGNNSRTISIS